jgi:hypothetical protein
VRAIIKKDPDSWNAYFLAHFLVGLIGPGRIWIETPASGGFFEEVQGSGQRAFRWFWDYGLIF